MGWDLLFWVLNNDANTIKTDYRQTLENHVDEGLRWH